MDTLSVAASIATFLAVAQSLKELALSSRSTSTEIERKLHNTITHLIVCSEIIGTVKTLEADISPPLSIDWEKVTRTLQDAEDLVKSLRDGKRGTRRVRYLFASAKIEQVSRNLAHLTDYFKGVLQTAVLQREL